MLKLRVQIWILWVLYAGTLSDEDVSSCDQQPCQNGGLCERHDDGFRCRCSQKSQNGQLYGGETCTMALSGCDDNRCENGGICLPLLVNDRHTYTCVCLAGYTGLHCQIPTAFSFERSGHMYIEIQLLDPEAPLNVTFSFRTGGLAGTLLQRRVNDLLLTIELQRGHLRLTSLRGQGSSTLVQELPENVSDDEWHSVGASLGGAISLIWLLCTEGGCARESNAEHGVLELGSSLPDLSSVRQSLILGAGGLDTGFGKAVDGPSETPAAFRGCFRDVFVDSQLVVPSSTDAQVNITMGCSDRDKCDDVPCQNRGRCVSQGWRSYRCECHRPYEGTDCEEEYITGRFGTDALESYAVFSLDGHPQSVSVSMFIRTKQPSGLLLVMANSTSQYLRLWLEEGRVKVQVNNFESMAGETSVNDGHFHLVNVTLEQVMAVLFQSSQLQASVAIRRVQAHPGDFVYVGGLPDPRASALFGSYFKGCVQDLRINGKRLQFFPRSSSVTSSHRLEQLINIAQGCSSNNACAENPCLNGGVCSSMWDDFTCSCPPNTAGRHCEEVKWCELSPCPSSAVCKSHSRGFECLSNVTLQGANSATFSYQGNGKIRRSLTSVSLSLRTRQTDATLLHAEQGLNYFTISLQDSHAVMELQAGVVADSPVVSVQTKGSLSDGEWHTLELCMEEASAESSRWTVAVDGQREETRASHADGGNLDFLRGGVDILLGGVGVGAGGALAACLGPVEIGGLPLPFHGDGELSLPRPQEERFVLTPAATPPPRYGCWGSAVCSPNPCQNHGVCEDLFDLSRCTCPSKWSGPLCQDPSDACASNPCLYGNCTVSALGYECSCESGYTGSRCEEVDTCQENNCGDGSTCLPGFEGYGCLCQHTMTGQYCREKISEVPWYIDAKPIPQLPVSECLGKRLNYSCFNGGNCTLVENTCDCVPGFIGQWCERDMDECASDPCMNGGFCINNLNGFECICDLTYSGIHCQMDVSDFYLYLFLSLWQNLFQIVSYLVWRLDDGPNIEWLFQMDD